MDELNHRYIALMVHISRVLAYTCGAVGVRGVPMGAASPLGRQMKTNTVLPKKISSCHNIKSRKSAFFHAAAFLVHIVW